MTFTAKVLVVLIFVLAIVFAAISGVLYTKRTDYKQTLEDLRAGLSEQVKAEQRRVELMQTRVTNIQEDFNIQKDKLTKAEASLSRHKKEIELKDATFDHLQKQLNHYRAENSKIQEILRASDRRRDQIEKELARRKKELESTRQDLLVTKEKAQDLTRKLATTREERDRLLGEKKALVARVKSYEKKFDALRKRYWNDEELVAIISRTEPVTKYIRGHVLSVDPFGNVIINRGTRDGVLKDYVFTIYRDNSYIARIRIFKVDQKGDLAAGKIVNLRPGQNVKQGDSVATRLIP